MVCLKKIEKKQEILLNQNNDKWLEKQCIRTDMHFPDVSFHVLDQTEFLKAVATLVWFVSGMNSLVDF